MSICSGGTQCPLYSAASLGLYVIGPHSNPPSHIILTPGRPVMFHGSIRSDDYDDDDADDWGFNMSGGGADYI